MNKDNHLMYKVNLHLTKRCNYHCKYCFAHFENNTELSLEQWKQIIDNLKNSGIVSAINFAGGEPVLYPHFWELVEYAHEQGFILSIITNGSLMLKPDIVPASGFAKLETLGVSVHSITPETLVGLGACTRSHKVLSYGDLKRLVTLARSVNPRIRIKLNTTVMQLNADEDLTEIGRELDIDRWKFLRMKVFKNADFDNEHLAVDLPTFTSFVSRHENVSRDVVVESDLTRSYLLVDNNGWLLDNAGENYEPVGNLLEEDFAAVFKRYHFDEKTYAERYAG